MREIAVNTFRAAEKTFVSFCAYTHTTDIAARWIGARVFLPKLFVLRYSNMGGLDPAVFGRQLAAARSFRDDRWCAYWNAIAESYVAGANRPDRSDIIRLGDLIAPAAALFADHGPQPSDDDIARHVDTSPGPDRDRVMLAYRTIDAWVKAITYYQISAFPGHSPQRMDAYHRSRQLFDGLLEALAPALDLVVEHVEVPVSDDAVKGILILPTTPGPHPTALITNGLEGTVQELAFPQLRYRSSGLATFLMEMPGSYAYRHRMNPGSERIYRTVIDHLVADDRLDSGRIGMVGVSFGGYWAARMAAGDERLACAVACGAPTHHSFRGAPLGIPQVIIGALLDTTGASTPLDLRRRLSALSIRDRYAHIAIPLLAINGDTDTLLSTQDTVELAEGAPDADLVLYPDDDHCAMRHYDEWLDHSHAWMVDRLAPVPHP